MILAKVNNHGHGEAAFEGLPQMAQPLPGTEEWLVPITNSMVTSWIITIVIVVILRLGTRKLQLIPTGWQNLVEAIIEGLHAFIGSLLDKKVSKWAFPLLSTFFLFIVASNLSGLFPFVGSFGYGEMKEGSSFVVEHVDLAFFRPPTADANMTIAMALAFFMMNLIWAIRYNGLGGLIHHIFGVKGKPPAFLLPIMIIIFIVVGIIEIVSIGIRPVALAARLYGNIYGGENVLTNMLTMVDYGVAAIPFYFLELLVALVQAAVFFILCIAFTATLCTPHEEGH